MGAAIVVCHNLPKFYGRPRAAWASCAPCPPPGYTPAYTIARAMAETDSYHKDFVHAVNSLDEVWVPSRFSFDVLLAAGVAPDRMHIVPLAVNTSFFTPHRHRAYKDVRAIPGVSTLQVFGCAGGSATALPAERIFLSVFKWENRKGWDVLLAAYLQHFTCNDPVVLLLLTKPFLQSSGAAEEITSWVQVHLPDRNISQLPRLLLIQQHISQEQYARLLASAHAFVLPTRGEGWGLPMVEAMAMGLPVIATNASGVTAYLDAQVGYPVPFTLVPVPEGEPFWFAGSRWAEPDVTSLQVLMGTVVDNPAEAQRRGQAARQRMLHRYSPAVVAGQLWAHFQRINAQLDSGRSP
ncbi:hypothetical protein V8C86DRAFT_2482499 [Haematococcus lacustris]